MTVASASSVGLQPSPRVLIIDDDAVLSRAVGRMLRGCVVEIENDPCRAVARIEANEVFDVIVSNPPWRGGRF